ncbi:MAG TPA: trigger factor family protein, partial [Dehalococcoidales bacterium]|nr:trigger factor family protein [Dehalococcoidales bacterium]
MKATKEKVENHQAYLTIEIEPAEMEKSLEGAYRRMVQKARIPGFRKGKAPRAIFERYVGKDSLFEDAIDHLVPDIYEQALKEQELEAIAQPKIEITQTEPVIMKAVVPLKPTIKLGDYKTIKVAREEVEVTEKNVDAVVEQLRHQHATWEPVERAVEHDDLIVMDIE